MRRTEVITWIPIAEQVPDDDTTVLLDHADADPWPGWYTDGQWYQADAMPVDPPKYWAHMPEGCAQ